MKTKTSIELFIKSMFEAWYTEETVSKAKIGLNPIEHDNIDYPAWADTDIRSKFGEYTLNDPAPDFKNAKIKIVELPDMAGKKMWEVAEYVRKTYKSCWIPDLRFMEYVCENKSKEFLIEDSWKWYYFFGSVLRRSDGNAGVPRVGPESSSFSRSTHWLGSDWAGNYRVVLVENDVDSLNPDFDHLNLDSAIKIVKEAGYKIIKEL